VSEYARRFVSSMAAQLLPVRGSRSRKRLVRQLLPYCVVETPEGYLLLNRNYKPLGWPIEGQSRVDYLDHYQFASLVIDRDDGADPASAGMHNVVTADGSFWFFYGGDKPAPWDGPAACESYRRRVAAFIGRSLTEAGGA
jgi:hypothetical protein